MSLMSLHFGQFKATYWKDIFWY